MNLMNRCNPRDLKPHPKNVVIYGDKADAALIDSVRKYGVIEPLVITYDKQIVSGHRRQDAAIQAGSEDIPYVVFPSQDELDIRQAILESNRQRIKTNLQFAREAQEALAIERVRAKKRQLANLKQYEGDNTVPKNSSERTGDARDAAGELLGKSGFTVEHAALVASAIDNLSNNGHKQEAIELVTKLDKSIDAAYKEAVNKGFITRSSNNPNPKAKPDYITLDMWGKLGDKERKNIFTSANPHSKAGFNFQDTNSIEWALWSWNPITGCQTNCPYCYARPIAQRFYAQGFTPSLYPSRLATPSNIEVPSEAQKHIGYKNVFACSMSDMFGDWVPAEWIQAVLQGIKKAPQWNFLILTKWPRRILKFDLPKNVWIGATVDCQERVAVTEDVFAQVKASVKFISCEPLIEPLTFNNLQVFNWVILGGRSVTTAMPVFHPPRQWIDKLEAQARSAGCKIYEKANLWGDENRLREYPTP